MSTENRKSTSSRLLVAAIDFGTTYSGYAYSFKSSWTKINMNKWEGGQLASYNAPTALLLNPDKSFNSFGYEAEKKYGDIATGGDDDGRSCKDYYFFHRFKMLKTTLMTRVHRETTCKDENGREVKAMLIFTFSIRYLKNHLLENFPGELNINVNDIYFVLTIPAIWNETAKLFMREAAIEAGIRNDLFEIILEPEAALIYCHLMHLDAIQRHNTTNDFTGKPGVKYMVVDIGGCTTDITVHQLQENRTLVQLVPASGGEWGGTNVDESFRQFLEDIFGRSVMETFKNDPDNIEDYFELWQEFEFKKKGSFSSNNITLSIPLGLTEIVKEKMNKKGRQPLILKELLKESKHFNEHITVNWNKLNIPKEIFEKFFNPTIKKITAHLSRMFEDNLISDVERILMVGGFSECELVQEQFKRQFGNTNRLVFPHEARYSVLKGAVYSGHCKDLLSQSVAAFTFGFQIWPKFDKSKYSCDRKEIVNGKERCRDVFLKLFTKGEPISSGLKKSLIFKPMVQGENVLECGIFVSNKKDPKYVDEPGCLKLGTLLVPLPNFERQTNVEIEESITYEKTHVKVSAINCKTKKKCEIIFDLLSPEVNLPL